MDALFDARGVHVGWIDRGARLFDTDLQWVGFIEDGHAWSTRTLSWLGPMDGLNCLDREGRLVAWNPKQPRKGMLAAYPPAPRTEAPAPPAVPPRPVKPAVPARPDPPAGGWSPLRWKSWLLQ